MQIVAKLFKLSWSISAVLRGPVVSRNDQASTVITRTDLVQPQEQANATWMTELLS